MRRFLEKTGFSRRLSPFIPLLLFLLLPRTAPAAPIISYNMPADPESDVLLTHALNLTLSYRLEAFPDFPLTDELPPSLFEEISLQKIWRSSDREEIDSAFSILKSPRFLIGRHVQDGGEIRSTIKIFSHENKKIRRELFTADIKSSDFKTFQKQLVTRFFKKMEGRKPHNPEIHFPPAPPRGVFDRFARAAYLLKTGKINSGAKQLDLALKTMPDYRDALYLAGKAALLQTHEYDSAIEKFRRIADADPTDAAAWFWLGFSSYLKGENNAAAEAFEQAKKHKTDIGIYSYLATIYQDTRQYGEAIENYREALTLDPKNADLWYRLASLHALINQRDEALRALRRALEIDADSFLPIARTDSDFAKWRRDEDFRELIRSFKK